MRKLGLLILCAGSIPLAAAAQEGAKPSEKLSADFSLARGIYRKLSGDVLARLSEVESHRVQVARRGAELTLSRARANQAKAGVGFAEGHLKEYTDATLVAEQHEADRLVAEAEYAQRSLDNQLKILRSVNPAKNNAIEKSQIQSQAAVTAARAKRAALLEYVKPLHTRELTSQIEEAKAKAEAADAILTVDAAEFELLRDDARDAELTDAEKKVVEALGQVGEEWTKLAAQWTSLGSLDEAQRAAFATKVEGIHAKLGELSNAWRRAEEDREAKLDASLLRKIKRGIGKPLSPPSRP